MIAHINIGHSRYQANYTETGLSGWVWDSDYQGVSWRNDLFKLDTGHVGYPDEYRPGGIIAFRGYIYETMREALERLVKFHENRVKRSEKNLAFVRKQLEQADN